MAALRLSRQLAEEQRAATAQEQSVLAGWSSWGAVPAIFDEQRPEWAAERAELRSILTDQEWSAASRTTINAHYTDPRIVASMWQALSDLGLTAGQVLEPGCGSGTFIGMAPDGVQITGVELDPTTAHIAQALYPGATIRAESFAETRYPAGTFDAAIGNVPFADVALHDRRYNPNGHSIHNHFILKSLELVRPGGVVAVLTSSFTMDATNPGARREMYDKADLTGAVRLPSGAHRRTAGTEALTDLLILRRREYGQEPGDDSWLVTQPARIDGQLHRLNGYYVQHPHRVLGQLGVGHGMYGAETLKVTGDLEQLPGQVREVLADIVSEATAAGATITQRPPGFSAAAIPITPEEGQWLGEVSAHPVSGFQTWEETGQVELDVPRAQHRELRELLSMRDMARTLLQTEAASADDTAELDDLRTRLRRDYTGYVDRYGPINRFTLITTRRLDPRTGEPAQLRRKPPVMKWLRYDPFASLLRALEIFDESTQRAVPAALLNERVVLPRRPILGVDTPDEAIAVALETDGELRLDRIAGLLGVDENTARAQLGDRVFDDPGLNRIIASADYLSGNVRVKLDEAVAGAETHPELAVNVEALQQVLPEPLAADEIVPQVGAVWISPADYQQFVRELLGDPRAVVEHGGGTVWAVKANINLLTSTSEWGTERRPAATLIAAMLEQRAIKVEDTLDDGSRVLNPTESEAARNKAAEISERFADWVWEDPERASRLVDEYNRRFNGIVLRDYAAEGDRLTLPGLAATFTPRPHQRAAVARMLAEPAVGLFHQVGAGKTAEMVMGAMELRRLGMASKPVVVVPNHMLEQFSREWLQLYPQAWVLAAGSDDLQRERRRDFVARVATGDWDGVVLTRTAFERMQVTPEAQAEYTETQLTERREVLERLKAAGGSLTVKRIEKKILQTEEKVKQRLDQPRDPGLYFEDTGIDYLIVDEAHGYKNLATESNIPDAALDGSGMASDLHMKIELLRRRHGERVVTLATATPIANSMTEAHVMSRYLRPDLLEAAGVGEFDAWAATFGKTVTSLEMSPTGGGWREKTRFASFQNVPEMLRMWHTFADVKTAEDLNLPTPELRARPDGERWPESVIVPPAEELIDYMATLDARAAMLSGRAQKGADNHLSILGDGRRAGLDIRLVGGGEPAGPHKLSVAADRIATIWRANRDREYVDTAGNVSPVPGAFQLVFCDTSTPKPDRWNAYSQLKSYLVERGLPARSVQFIHDAGTDDTKKARLFEACRSGEVAVLIGSTEKMGVGTNVQARAIALHHIDCPWRPADLEQRDGRILRQGNQHPEVEIIRYATGRSLDAYSWQTVERKQKFISQVLRGRLDVREMEDIGDAQLSMGEMKAIIADDPLVLEQATANSRLAKLERLSRAHQKQLSMLQYRAGQASATILKANADEPLIQQAIARSIPTAGDAFSATVNDRRHTDRVDAARAIRDALLSSRSGGYLAEPVTLDVTIAGLPFTFERIPSPTTDPQFRGAIDGVPRSGFLVSGASLHEGIGVVRVLENRATALPTVLAALNTGRDDAQSTEAQARANMTKPFKYATELAGVRGDVARINQLMVERAKPEDRQDEPGTAQCTALDAADADVAEASRIVGLSNPAATIRNEHPRPSVTGRPHSLPAPRDGRGRSR